MAAKKYYAIAVGRRPGIYDNWPAAQAQVTGYPGAVFKGFPSRAAAEAWLRQPTRTPSVARKKVAAGGAAATTTTVPVDGEVTIYTDGGARFNPGPGGYGIVRICDGKRMEFSGGYRLTTNNRMELMGCIVALRQLEDRSRAVTIYTDSSYVVNGISKGWAKSWRKNGWIKSDKKPAVNPDLWAELLDLVEPLAITFRWVRGHAGNPLNERCDELAVAASYQDGLPADTGYESMARSLGG
ncbi:MAG: ribonuclease HI [Deltaproteobacteria bacterium RIFOXYD12_FULL_57_12]|nr:MAG: ribonuclease HI [Deltaproteobacteria bacterium RIFOXYD12_FULL_57_12]